MSSDEFSGRNVIKFMSAMCRVERMHIDTIKSSRSHGIVWVGFIWSSDICAEWNSTMLAVFDLRLFKHSSRAIVWDAMFVEKEIYPMTTLASRILTIMIGKIG